MPYVSYTCSPLMAAHYHGPNALVSEQLHEQRVWLPAIDDVRRANALGQTPDTALHLRAQERS